MVHYSISKSPGTPVSSSHVFGIVPLTRAQPGRYPHHHRHHNRKDQVVKPELLRLPPGRSRLTSIYRSIEARYTDREIRYGHPALDRILRLDRWGGRLRRVHRLGKGQFQL